MSNLCSGKRDRGRGSVPLVATRIIRDWDNNRSDGRTAHVMRYGLI